MNQIQEKTFYQELMESNFFHKKQKDYIKRVYEEHQAKIKAKIRLGMNMKCDVGRPEKLKNIDNFILMCNYYKNGYISLKDIMQMFDIKYKSSFYRYYEKYFKEMDITANVSKEFTRDKLENIFNTYAYGYANKYAEKIYNNREDFKQECLTRMWNALLNYDESISIRALFNNVCYRVLDDYFNEYWKDKKVVRYEEYQFDNGKSNKLDRYFSQDEEVE